MVKKKKSNGRNGDTKLKYRYRFKENKNTENTEISVYLKNVAVYAVGYWDEQAPGD